MNTTTRCQCESPDGHDAECPRPRCPKCSEVYALDTSEKIYGVVYCGDCAYKLNSIPHECRWCHETFPARDMVNDGMWKCWPCNRAESGLDARDCDGINAQTGAAPSDHDYFNYGRGR